jgi:hypothetical protein
MSIEIIEIQVSSELARRLRPYQSELPRILEWGLYHVEKETEAKTRTEPAPEAMSLQKRIVAILHQVGAVGPEPEEVAQYLAERENRRWMPIQAGGKPASEMIVEERDSRPWTRW